MSETRALLISVKPKHALEILNKKKTIELRKWLPKDFVGWVYIYITKEKPIITLEFAGEVIETCNGKIVARFWFDECVKIIIVDDRVYVGGKTISHINQLAKESCLDFGDLKKYDQDKNLYAWRIKKLEIFYNPKELAEFYYYKKRLIDCGMDCPPYFDEVKTQVRKAPKKGVYIYVKE